MTSTGHVEAQESRVQDPWGARARDWAEIEDENSRRLFEAVFELTGVGEGKSLLDVGCGSGLACSIAAAWGANPHGLDSSPGMLEAARQRLPTGDFRTGDMVSLPYEDDSFDLVTFFNTIFFASDVEAAVREAARVTRADGQVAIVAWPSPDQVELTRYLAAVQPLLPPGPDLNPFLPPDALGKLAAEAGLAPERVVELDWSWGYPDRETAVRGLMSPGPSTLAVEAAGKGAVRGAIESALEPFRLASGGYRLENVVHCLLARA
jgi:SAM-dependent methyltransferase